MTALLKKDVEYTLEEYIELEKISEERLLFKRSKIYNLSDESIEHCVISGNILFQLKSKSSKIGKRVFSSNLKLKVPNYPSYLYADGSAVVEKPQTENFFDFEFLTNPGLIVEVLSDSTKSFDLGDKFTYYKSIESFTEYLLIDQDRPHVILYTKQAENVWLQREYNVLTDTVYLNSLDCEINLTDIYENIEFSNPDHPKFGVGLEREARN